MAGTTEADPRQGGDPRTSSSGDMPEFRPRWAINLIVAWILLQVPRLIAIPLIADVLDDRESDAWLYPAILDVVVAVAAPVVAYLVWRRRGLAVWVIAIVFFVVSIIDHGDAVTAGLTAAAPEVFGGDDAPVPATVVPTIQAVIDVLVLFVLTSKKMRTYYLAPRGSSSIKQPAGLT